MKSKYTIDLFDEKDIKNSQSYFPDEYNQYETETAGFVPLEVKMKQFEQNGLIAQFQVQDFDSHDYRDMYLNPDFNITPEDDLEEVQEKIAMQREFINNLKKSKVGSLEQTANLPSGSAAASEKKQDEAKEEVNE